MSFSPKIYEEALVACDRRCCICHKFCGKHIELHHIVQEADGGPDTLENAIPLCFDCHADMGKTDTHHPKGRGYTENELKKHRDHWYSLVKAGIVDQTTRIITIDDETKKDYLKRYRELRFQVSCALDYYANVYSDIVENADDRHEKASDDLRKIGVMIKAFATESQPEDLDIPDVKDLKEAGGLFIGLSNCLYCHKGEDSSWLLDANLKSEDRIRKILSL